MSDQPISLIPTPPGYAEALPDAEFVQAVLAQLSWYHQLALLDKLLGPETQRWYATKAIEQIEIESELGGFAE